MADTSRGPTPSFEFTAGNERVVLAELDVGPLRQLSTFSIRNGDPRDAKSLLVRSTMPTAWHWQDIPGLPTELSIKHVSAFIRQTYAHLRSHGEVREFTGMDKKKCLIIAVARAVIRELYSIEEHDLIPGEVAAPLLSASQSADGSYSIGTVPGLSQGLKTDLGTDLGLDDTDREAIALIHMSAIGILPLQGYSLVMTNHHYLSEGDNQSKRAYTVVERQIWTNSNLADWWRSDDSAIRNLLWHHVAHPVSLSLKRELAQREDIPVMLTTAGVGSAAARLPAVEPEVRRANSYRTLLKTVTPLVGVFGGDYNYILLENAMETVRMFPHRAYEADTAARPRLPDGTPASVRDRRSALAYLKDVCDRNSDIVATAYGFYCALSEASQMAGTATGTDTLKSSYSLKSLKEGSMASYTYGVQSHGDYVSARSSMRQKGEFMPAHYTFK